MGYVLEFRQHSRRLLASTLGMASGLAFAHYVMSLFAPPIIAEFGWSKAQYALIGASPLVTMFFLPMAGRVTDRIGTRLAAAIGFTALPASYLALSFMTGSFKVYFILIIFKTIFGTLTTTMVFARVIVERFDRGRGLALSIAMTGPPLAGALMVPFIAEIIADHGWRDAFRVLALFAVVSGVVTILLMGKHDEAHSRHLHRPKLLGTELRAMFRSRLFLVLLGGMMLVNIPQSLTASQLLLVVLENGVSGQVATGIVALYAAGVAIGRICSGLALDRFAAHKVALVFLGLPAIGLSLIASSLDAPWILTSAVMLIGLAQGGEGDIGAYIVSRKFPLRHYSMITGFLATTLALGAAAGALILSLSLGQAGNYNIFLIFSAGMTLIGATLFFMTGHYSSISDNSD